MTSTGIKYIRSENFRRMPPELKALAKVYERKGLLRIVEEGKAGNEANPARVGDA